MSHYRMPILDETGYVVLDSFGGVMDSVEWLSLEYVDCLYNSHLDNNNRLNPDGEGSVVRNFMQLTDNADSIMALREDVRDPSTETRLRLPAGAQLVVDSERMWHSVWHTDSQPRYCLINSFESGPELEAHERRDACTAFYGYDPSAVYSQA